MELITAIEGQASLWTGVVPHAIACGLVWAMWLGAWVMKLLSERSRRKTLLAFARQAPTGTTLVQANGPGLPAFWVKVGSHAAASAMPPEQE